MDPRKVMGKNFAEVWRQWERWEAPHEIKHWEQPSFHMRRRKRKSWLNKLSILTPSLPPLKGAQDKFKKSNSEKRSLIVLDPSLQVRQSLTFTGCFILPVSNSSKAGLVMIVATGCCVRSSPLSSRQAAWATVGRRWAGWRDRWSVFWGCLAKPGSKAGLRLPLPPPESEEHFRLLHEKDVHPIPQTVEEKAVPRLPLPHHSWAAWPPQRPLCCWGCFYRL